MTQRKKERSLNASDKYKTEKQEQQKKKTMRDATASPLLDCCEFELGYIQNIK
jgi:hypothetical protein